MLDAKTRKVLYLVMAVSGLLVGALQSAWSGVDLPEWLRVVSQVYAYLSGPVGILATLNTPIPVELADDVTEADLDR